MTQDDLAHALAPVVAIAESSTLDSSLQSTLNERFPATGDAVRAIAACCDQGIQEGWLCARGDPELRFGRVFKAGTSTGSFSVDVVDMVDVAGPFHAHPQGEIDLVLPVDEGAAFDGHHDGWVVYPAGSSHFPTVSGGRARVLYLLPGGEIDFTVAPPEDT
jgi:hypothetical protein